MSKQTSIFLLLIVAAFVGGYYFSNPSSKALESGNQVTPTIGQTAEPTGTAITLDQVKALFNDKNMVFGDKNSKLLFVEFSDPSCPYCHVAAGKNGEINKKIDAQFILKSEGGTYLAPESEIKKLVDAGKAAFVWLYANGHGNGEMATQALYCAYESGKFWQVHDKLMSMDGYLLMNTTIKTDKTQTGVMADFLKNVFDSKTMKSCLDGGKYANRIVDDMAIIKKIGFKGTPYFLVNTTEFVGAQNFTEMQSAVEAVLK